MAKRGAAAAIRPEAGSPDAEAPEVGEPDGVSAGTPERGKPDGDEPVVDPIGRNGVDVTESGATASARSSIQAGGAGAGKGARNLVLVGTDQPDARKARAELADADVPESGASLIPKRPNPISRTVEEIVRLLVEIEDGREELMARGIQNQTLNVLIEFGMHGREEGREMMIEAALSSAAEEHGINAIEREELERRLADLLALELDVSHARRIARQQGIDLQVLNFMTRLIQKNPGDGGERVVNAFFGYALACGIPLAGIEEVVQRVGGAPKSVLPDIDREAYEDERWTWRDLLRDAALGVCLAVGILWLLT